MSVNFPESCMRLRLRLGNIINFGIRVTSTGCIETNAASDSTNGIIATSQRELLPISNGWKFKPCKEADDHLACHNLFDAKEKYYVQSVSDNKYTIRNFILLALQSMQFANAGECKLGDN